MYSNLKNFLIDVKTFIFDLFEQLKEWRITTDQVINFLISVFVTLMLILVLILLRTAITPDVNVAFPVNQKVQLFSNENESIGLWISPDRKVNCYIYNDYVGKSNSMDCFSSTDLNFLQFNANDEVEQNE